MKLTVDKKLKCPIYLQIASQIREKIIKGDLVDGYALPSERALAKSIGVHRNTVVRAYNELKADGMITSYQGVGYRVYYKEEEIQSRKRAVNWQGIIKTEYLELESAFDDLFLKSQT